MLTKLELYGMHGERGFCAQRYYFEDDSLLVEEGLPLTYGRLSPRFIAVASGVEDIADGAKYHWGP